MTGLDLPEALRRATSLGEIDDLLARVQREPGLDEDERAQAIVVLVEALSSRDLGDRERQAELRERYLLTALEQPRQPAPELEAQLLDLLGDAAPGPGADERWPARRRRLARAWMQALERAATAPASGEEPPLVSPPAPEGLPGGAAPEGVGDPAARAEYEASIARHREQVEAHRRAHVGRGIARSLAPKLEDRVVEAYATPPPATDELAQDLDRELSDPEARARILQAVRART